MDALFTFITMAFPKAGIQIAGLPLTLNLLLTVYVVLRHPNQTLLLIQRHKNFFFLYMVLFFFGTMSILLDLVQGAKPFFLAQMVIVLISPLVGVSITRISSDNLLKIVIFAMIIANFYGIIQYAIGIDHVAIPGVTYTYGQNIFEKPIGWSAENGTAEKIISTYQNGNSFGLFVVLGICFLLSHKLKNHIWEYARLFALFLGFVGFLLCGSRSIQIPFILFLVVLLSSFIKQLSPRRRSITLFIGGIGCAAGVGFLLCQKTILAQFSDRLITQTLASSTGNGRTTQWAHDVDVISGMKPLALCRQMLLGQNPHTDIGGEGLPKFFCIFGLISTCAFFGGLVAIVHACWKRVDGRIMSMGILCVLIAFCVDQSFLYPPNVMNIALFAVATLYRRQNR